MYEKEMILLKRLKYLIKKSPANARKLMLIGDFDNLAIILQDLGVLNDDYQMNELGEDYEWYFQKLNEKLKTDDKRYLDNIEMISKITEELRIFGNNHSLIHPKSPVSQHVDKKYMDEALIEFIHKLDKDFYNLFRLLVDKTHILSSNEIDLLGATYGFNSNIHPYILIKNTNNIFQKYVTFIHELGHCYELYYNQANLGLTHTSPLSEIVSLSLEKMFLDFLIANNIYCERAFNEKIRWQIQTNLMNACVCFSNYAIVNNLATFEDSEIIPDFDLYFMDDLDDDVKDATLNYDLSFTNYRYVLSDIVANNFVEWYRDNHKKGIEHLKKYVTTCFQSDLKDILENYGNLRATKDEIKSLVKYQQSKK